MVEAMSIRQKMMTYEELVNWQAVTSLPPLARTYQPKDFQQLLPKDLPAKSTQSQVAVSDETIEEIRGAN